MQTVIAIIGIVIAIIGLLLGWPEIKKYVPFLPKPLIRILYEKSATGNITAIVFDNSGNAVASYFTVDIRAKSGSFSVDRIHADFELSTSGRAGTWTVISGRNILPQQKGSIILRSTYGSIDLEPPQVRSDSRSLLSQR